MRRRRSQAGFTLVELMISLVLFSIAIAGVLAVAVSMAQGYREQRQTVETEGAARGAMDYIADAIRQTSPGVSAAKVDGPNSNAAKIVVGAIQDTRDCSIGTLTVENQTAGPDSIDLIFASGGVVTSLRSTYDGSNLSSITVPVTGAADLREGDTLLITDGTTGHLARIATTAGAVNTATGVIALETFACSPTFATPYASGALVIRAMRAKFFIGPFDGSPLALLMDPDPANNTVTDIEPLADHVEDMQIALGIDDNDDGTIANNEWYFGGAAAPPTAGRVLRAVRITLIARASTELTGGTATFVRPGAEDRGASTGPDKYRRRVLSTTIEIRNLENSP